MRPMRFFNTAGPMKPDIHYCIPPLERLDAEQVRNLIRQQKYFVLHAPRADRQDLGPAGAAGRAKHQRTISLRLRQRRGWAERTGGRDGGRCRPS